MAVIGTGPPVQDSAEGAVIRVHVRPQAARTEYVGRQGGAFTFRVAAPPVEGKANEALCAYLAERFGLPKSGVTVRSGQSSRQKRVLLKNVTAATVLRTLGSQTDGARVHQINVSQGGVPKFPVAEARITVQGVSGDRHRSPKIHGGPERAVCLFSLELIEALQQEGHPIGPGSTGENLTLAGIAWQDLKPGSRVQIGDAVRLEIVRYTAPCEHNARWFLDRNFMRISQKRHPGWSRMYARVLTEGAVRTGDPVTIL